MTIDEIKLELERTLSAKRFDHSLGVMDTSARLAEKYGGNVGKAALTGLLHDCAREIKGSEVFELCEKYDIEIDCVSKVQPELLHGSLGAVIAEKKFNVTDREVLTAITYHTTGCKDMSLLTKIVFIADYIEPGRKFEGVEEIRRLAFEDIDSAIISALGNTIIQVISRGLLIHPHTIDARNHIIFKRG